MIEGAAECLGKGGAGTTCVAFVYGLRFSLSGHPHDGLIRYVGKTINPDRRMRQHMAGKDAGGRLARSVRKHGSGAFSMEVLATYRCATIEDAEACAFQGETEFIAIYDTADGDHGLNQTLGGDGARLVGEARERQRLAAQAKLREILSRPEVQQKHAERTRLRFADEAFRKSWQAYCNERSADPNYREKLKEAVRRRKSERISWALFRRVCSLARSEADRQRSREQLIRINTDPDVRRKQIEGLRQYYRDEVHRKRKAETSRKLHKDPAFSRKYRAGIERRYSDPAKRAEHAATTSARHRADPCFTLSAKLGIALRWAEKHRRSGNAAGLEKQLVQLRFLLISVDAIGDERLSGLASRARSMLGR